MAEELKALSASRIKTLESCSWKYWCNYHLRIPQKDNLGALLGTICHTVLECLAKPRRRAKFHAVTEAKSIKGFPCLIRLIDKYLMRNAIHTEENKEKICKMIWVALVNDFLIDGKTSEMVCEQEFDIINESPQYRIKGYMDKIAVKGKYVIIDDYKTSKKQFSGEDLESNVQAMTYSLVAKKWHAKLKPVVRFIFLQYPESPIQRLMFKASALLGFEEYLAKIQKLIQNFTERDAHRNFAADIPPPPNEFAGQLLCGFAKKPDELKKDGTLKWCCPYKFAFKYFVQKDEKGNIIKSALTEDKLVKTKGLWIEEKQYEGCPRYSKAIIQSESTHEVCTAVQIEL